MVSPDSPGPRRQERGPEYERALVELREVLELPIVGYPHREQELVELRRLISKYVDEARGFLAELDHR
ncbi:hypothetical protein GCM10023195_86270 [Actinoallomurus liliacearum]|uniref:Uncharacterized protein n=1 Tax=Actinoallomurus liliacearum TaxID=1080073 RepID=A0ABP8U0N4_9ACTN